MILTGSGCVQSVCLNACVASEIRPRVSGVHPFLATAADGTVSAYHIA